ncbi:MAG: hydroxyacylglutathione hydrolase [Rhizomicrobium sp.]
MPLKIELVPCLTDNYAYLIEETQTGLCAVVDPSEAEPVRRALAGRKLAYILNTHHHPDHVGGNLELKAQFGAQVVGPAMDRARIPGIDIGVDEASGWQFGPLAVQVLEIPAHTRSHIAFVMDGAVFTGDTLFAMGCGRLFEGTAQMLWQALEKLMRLPDATRIYCGHEYTLNNGRFALTLEPGNAALKARMAEVERLRANHTPTIPSTIALEKATNPFLRPTSIELRRSLGLEHATTIEVIAETRRRKDTF